MTALELNDLHVTIGTTTIVDGVSLSVAAGEWLTVIGPNGAGKSTLLRAIAGLLPAAGTVTARGKQLSGLPRRERARRIAMVAQNPVVPPGMTVFDYVLLGRTPYVPPLGRESTADLDITAAVCRRLDLTGFADRRLETLSGGERQRAFLARALTQLSGAEAAILLLDEPTTALDIGHQQEVLELVDGLRDGGLTVMSTMHELSIAGEYADRLLLLDAGRAVALGSPSHVLTEELLSRHYRASVRVIEGGSGPVVIPVRRHDAGNGKSA
jgi:iron complex transport system ATP-binding protein